MIDTAKLAEAHFHREMQWSSRDVQLFALATGYGESAPNEADMPWYDETRLVPAPGFAAMIARNAAPTVGDLGGDYDRTVLAMVATRHAVRLPAQGTISASTVVRSIADRGEGRGAFIWLETRLHSRGTDHAIVHATMLARGDGGCGSFGPEIDRVRPAKGLPDKVIPVPTRPDQALLYRLLGDSNRLHLDPAVARAAGFFGPILHGLCTYGIVWRVLQASVRASARFRASFRAPVYPGEALELRLWLEDGALELHAPGRGALVLAGDFTV